MIKDLVEIYKSGAFGVIDETYHPFLTNMPKIQDNAMKVFVDCEGKIESYLFLTEDSWINHLYFVKDAKNNFPLVNIKDSVIKPGKNLITSIPNFIELLLAGNRPIRFIF